MSATVGVLMILASAGVFWAALRRKHGETPALFGSRWVLEEAVPVVVLSGLALGLTLVANGLLG
jgi:hypothetical protein